MVEVIIKIKKEYLGHLDEIVTHLTYHGVTIDRMEGDKLFGQVGRHKIQEISNLEEVDFIDII